VTVEVFDRATHGWDAVLPALLKHTEAPVWVDFHQCTTHACTESGMPPSVVVVSGLSLYTSTAIKRVTKCVHLARISKLYLLKQPEWDLAWLIKQTVQCLNVDICLHFGWTGSCEYTEPETDGCLRAPDDPARRTQAALAALPLLRHQALNTIPGFVPETNSKVEFCRKLRLVGAGFYPECYTLPGEWDALQRSSAAGAYWIYKPDARSNGMGISIHHGAGQVPNVPGLVQQYLQNPFLSPEGFKLDIRVYGVITGTDPLRLYLWSDSYVRVAGAKYSMDNLGDANAHVTNSFENTSYQRYTFTQLRALVARAGGDFDRVWRDMVAAVTKAVLATAWTLGCRSDKWAYPCGDRRFQFLGADLALTSTFEVRMLEINADPSFKYRNDVISDDDSRMYKDLLDMLGFTEAGSFLGVPGVAARISQFCGPENEACCRELQAQSKTLGLLLVRVCVCFY
jgi:hypothetical protein